MSDNTAILAGYTQEFMASNGETDIHIFAKPNSDFDGVVTVYDADNCEFIRLNGWLWTFEEMESE